MVEQDKKVVQLLRENVDLLDGDEVCEIVQADALGPMALSRAPRPCHIVHFDPPYPLMKDPKSRGRVVAQFARAIDLLDPTGFAVIRTPCPFVDFVERGGGESERVSVDMTLENAEGPETHEYGTTAVHLYMKKQD